jgi:anti-sigma factor RsiW
MNCFSCEDRLSDYLEDVLTPEERSEVEAHIQSCSACEELLAGVRNIMGWGADLEPHLPPSWLSTRIVANTPLTIRITWRDWFRSVWRTAREPRLALSLLTSALMLGWMGSVVGISMGDIAMVRHPSAVYSRLEGWANRLYGDAVRSYYSSPLVNTIQCEIHSRIEQLRENS